MTVSEKSKRNHRPLVEITADIYRAERQNLFTIGKLLREAKEHFPHGKWLPYLKSIDYSPRNSQLYMSAFELADKYETVSHLGAATTAIYALVWLSDREKEEEREGVIIPLAIERLQASVARGDSAKEQRAVVELSPMARLNPGVTELALRAASDAINQNCFGCPIRMKSMEDQARAVIKANPATEEELKAITDKHPIMMPGGKMTVDEAFEHTDKKGVLIVEDDDDDQADEEETPPTTDKDDLRENLLPRQRAMVGRFDDACGELLGLAAKASAVFANSTINHVDLDMLGNFLKQIAASKRKAVGDDLEIPECLRRAS